MSYASLYSRLFLLLCLSSCAAALVPETSDPNEKLKQSFELVSLKRGIAAEKVINQAMEMFQSKGNKEGMARAYYAYALLYRSNASHSTLRLPDNYKAGESYDKAANIYQQLRSHKYAADTYILASIFYGLGNKIEKTGISCRTLVKAKISAGSNRGLLSEVAHHQKKMGCI